MSKSEEIREIVGWLDGFSAAVWLLPIDKVSDEHPAMYEEKIARLRKLLAEGGRGMIKFDTRPEIALSRDMWRKCADERRAERDQALQEAKELREELETAKAEYQRHRANLVECYAKKADESRRRGKAMHDMSQLIRERNEEIKSLKERVAEMEPRLMPEGMEWPRYDTGEPVQIGGEFMGKDGKTYTAKQIQFIGKCFSLYDFCDRKPQFNGFYGEPVKRPAPKVIGADGNRIETAMDVWWVCEGDERGVHAERLHVDGIDGDGMVECSPYNVGTSVVLDPAELYVHKPVLDADGVPIKEGDTVWPKYPYEEPDRQVESAEVVYVHRLGRIDIQAKYATGMSFRQQVDAKQLTHTKPEPRDSWERIEEDAAMQPHAYCVGHMLYGSEDEEGTTPTNELFARDLVRRCKALAERGE